MALRLVELYQARFQVINKTILSVLILLVSGCSMQAVDFKDKTPKLVLEEYFTKNISARGAFFDRKGDIKTRILINTSGSWDGKVLTLNEQLKYESGEVHKRTFLISKVSDNLYTVRCDEFVGEGTIESYGNALHWTYKLKEHSKQAGGWTLSFDDWMFLSEDNYIINRATAYKWGFRVGDVVLSLKPE